MHGVASLTHLTILNLPNNGIVAIDGKPNCNNSNNSGKTDNNIDNNNNNTDDNVWLVFLNRSS